MPPLNDQLTAAKLSLKVRACPSAALQVPWVKHSYLKVLLRILSNAQENWVFVDFRAVDKLDRDQSFQIHTKAY